MAKTSNDSEAKASKPGFGSKGISAWYKLEALGGTWLFAALMAVALRSSSLDDLANPDAWIDLKTLPEGLVDLLPAGLQAILGGVGWLVLAWIVYLGLTYAAIRTKKSLLFHLAWLILAVLLVLNLFGGKLLCLALPA